MKRKKSWASNLRQEKSKAARKCQKKQSQIDKKTCRKWLGQVMIVYFNKLQMKSMSLMFCNKINLCLNRECGASILSAEEIDTKQGTRKGGKKKTQVLEKWAKRYFERRFGQRSKWHCSRCKNISQQGYALEDRASFFTRNFASKRSQSDDEACKSD